MKPILPKLLGVALLLLSLVGCDRLDSSSDEITLTVTQQMEEETDPVVRGSFTADGTTLSLEDAWQTSLDLDLESLTVEFFDEQTDTLFAGEPAESSVIFFLITEGSTARLFTHETPLVTASSAPTASHVEPDAAPTTAYTVPLPAAGPVSVYMFAIEGIGRPLPESLQALVSFRATDDVDYLFAQTQRLDFSPYVVTGTPALRLQDANLDLEPAEETLFTVDVSDEGVWALSTLRQSRSDTCQNDNVFWQGWIDYEWEPSLLACAQQGEGLEYNLFLIEPDNVPR